MDPKLEAHQRRLKLLAMELQRQSEVLERLKADFYREQGFIQALEESLSAENPEPAEEKKEDVPSL